MPAIPTLSNAVNELTKIDSTELLYDDAGNLTKDTNGYTYRYDYENRLTLVKKTNDSVDVAKFDYDALGRRILKIDYIADSDQETHYYYNGLRVLSEYDWDSGISTENRLRYFVYGAMYIDEVILMYTASYWVFPFLCRPNVKVFG